MRKMILSALMAAVTLGAAAQEPAAGGERNEWLPSFSAVDVSGAFDIVFVRVPDTEAPKIVYDTKGSYTSKFKAEVKDKVLYVTEKIDSRRPERTSVKVYYNEVRTASVSDAVASFEGVVKADMFDLNVGGVASVTVDVDVKDLWLDLSGRSNVTLTGKVRYFTLAATSGSVFASKLEAMSVQASATTGAAVTVWATERFEGRTTTNGKISYKGHPSVVRGGAKFMGGDIKAIE